MHVRISMEWIGANDILVYAPFSQVRISVFKFYVIPVLDMVINMYICTY